MFSLWFKYIHLKKKKKKEQTRKFQETTGTSGNNQDKKKKGKEKGNFAFSVVQQTLSSHSKQKTHTTSL